MNSVQQSPFFLDEVREFLAIEIRKSLATLVEGELPETLSIGLVYQALERPPEELLGDYALPCFRFAKDLKRKPPEIAQGLAERLLTLSPQWIEKAEAAGAFCNLTLRPERVAECILPQLKSAKYWQRLHQDNRPKVMIEYSQPNTHKAFHVGHMRNVALGDALGRLYRALHYPVIMANYIGDEGAHIAKCLWFVQKHQHKAPTERQGEWLGEMYSQATIALEDASPEQAAIYQKEVSAILKAIESKEGPVYQQWQETREWSLRDFKEIYDWVSARFDHWYFESEVSEASQKIVDDYLAQSIFVPSEGAIGMDLKEEKLGFVILRKSDGNTTYATKDLALAKVKYLDFAVKKSIYVVASEQNLHFKQVFRTLEKMGFGEARDCFHLSYGMVVLPDGKMSSRKGNVIKFRELRECMEAELDKNLEKYKGEWSEEERLASRRKLAVGAIRYGMICSDPVKDIVFHLQDWLSFEGNTGPYLMYTYARTRSILRKAADQGFSPNYQDFSQLQQHDERVLLRFVNDIRNSVEQACLQNKPSILCHHLFDSCKIYNRFLANVSILKAETAELRATRLALLEAFSLGLKEALSLLGLEVPERM